MSGCLEVRTKMTGSTSSVPPHPPKDVGPKTEQYQSRGKLISRPQSGQQEHPMQLTPLWEHVVRTRRFPMSVDVESTFREIGERLRDPEWEVRQHALRVLVDVLPVLDHSSVDELMTPIVPDLVTNLGHGAPAVRKGALDTLRVYLCCTSNKETMFQQILGEGFNRPDALDNFQSNVTMGIILSVPSLLFPSTGSPRPPETVLKFAVNALAARLVQVTHQEAALRSLVRIREIIGAEEFDSYMLDYNANVKRDFEVLCDVYEAKISPEKIATTDTRSGQEERKEIVPLAKTWDGDSESSGGTDDDVDEVIQRDVLITTKARVVLETEIKFDQETAITMTILEEKDRDSEETESETDGDFEPEDAGVVKVLEDVPERRKTPRRVRFGGEVVKLRTPDSDEASVEPPEPPRTKIPLPVFPATKMPLGRRRSSSQPTSPSRKRHKNNTKRSLSNSPRREIYVHNALLSPKKSILARPRSPDYEIHPGKVRKGHRRRTSRKIDDDRTLEVVPRLRHITEIVEYDIVSEPREKETAVIIELPESRLETDKLAKSAPDLATTSTSSSREVNSGERVEKGDKSPKTSDGSSPSKTSPKRSSRPTSKTGFEVFPKQERNYILMELSSPERKKHLERKQSNESDKDDSSPFGPAVNDAAVTSDSTPMKDTEAANQLFGQIIDIVSVPEKQTSNISTTQGSVTSNKDRPNADEATLQTTQETEQAKKLGTISSPKYEDNSPQKGANAMADGRQNPVATAEQKKIDNCAQTELVNEKNQSYREITSAGRPVVMTHDESESLTYSSSEGEGCAIEPSWEKLGLVDQDTLDDLHNTEDWRAQVRGFEHLASALKMTSAIHSVETRLPSLLNTVLGGKRSSRISASGMNVARVVVAGVSEDALRRALPKLAWGLSRQGGPLAAQLARIAMLRLRPALLLDQLLQPQCLGARNGKTRENTLQLLIFSLVTFPSTEFKVQTVARRVAESVGDRRRRVRQAALDTLAVLGQIYETEEVLEAGERAANGRHDSEAMKAAIRSRLARKSLPLVSADGLVVYGLQISPNIRIATGPDVDWIVAGSGSLSPGSGRSRGQLIGMTGRVDSANAQSRSEITRNNHWTETDLVTVGVGIGPENHEQSQAWKRGPVQNQDEPRSKTQVWTLENVNASLSLRPLYLRLQNPLNPTTIEGKSLLLYEDQARTRNDQLQQEARIESRIPVLHPKERTAPPKDMSAENLTRRGIRGNVKPRTEMLHHINQGSLVNVDFNHFNGVEQQDENIGYGSIYQRRRRLIDGNNFQTVQMTPNTPSNHYSHSEQRYGSNMSARRIPESIVQDSRLSRGRIEDHANNPFRFTDDRDSSLAEVTTLPYETIENSRGRSQSPERRSSSRSRPKVQNAYYDTNGKIASHNASHTSSIRDTYGEIYQRRRRLIDGNAFRPLRVTSNEVDSHYVHQSHRNGETISDTIISSRNTTKDNAKTVTVRDSRYEYFEREQEREELPKITRPENGNQHRGSSHSLDRRQRLSKTRAVSNLDENGNTKPRRDEDKAVIDDEVIEYDQRRQPSPQPVVYNSRNVSSKNSQPQLTRAVQEVTSLEEDKVRSASADSTTSDVSNSDSHRSDVSKTNENQDDSQEDVRSFKSARSHANRSSSPRSQRSNAFDVVPLQAPLSRRGSAASYAISITSKRSSAPEFPDPSSSSADEDLLEPNDEFASQQKRSHDSKINVRDDTEESTDTDNTKDETDLARSSIHDDESNVSLKISKESLRTNKSRNSSANSLHSKQAFHRLVDNESVESFEDSPINRDSRGGTADSNHGIVAAFSRYDEPEINANEHHDDAESLKGVTTEYADLEEERIHSPGKPDDSVSIHSLGSRSFQELDHPEIRNGSNSETVVRSSNSRGNEKIELIDDIREDFVESPYPVVPAAEFNDSTVTYEPVVVKDDTFDAQPTEFLEPNRINNNVTRRSLNNANLPEIAIGKEVTTFSEQNTGPPRRQSSRVPRLKVRPRVNSTRTHLPTTANTSKSADTSKIAAQLCFNQLDNKDWEVITKGLKTLTQIARHHPTQLELCGPGTLGRIIGRHVQNLRSQVSRAACLAAGEVFMSQPKGIEQEIDDIAGPLLHRTADTNRFLRADSNAALDHMVQNISPHKTICVVIHRGATHQNPIVRATAARLLADVIDRIGPNQAMHLPRDARDKLLVAGSKMLMEGNLDARNYAKRMFRGLTRCDGFQKALKDAVPETTLRHIDKTLKSL